jgi:DNA primase
MRFPPSLLDEIRARLPVSQVVARKVKLKRQGREYAGLSPFKVEKTPSFFVNDQKGFYHCFSSGEHGDIFKFLMLTEGLSFPEAVARLAEEAGLPLPKPSPKEAEQHDRRARLYELMEVAAQYYVEQLMKPAGREALRYIEGRGLARDTLTRFRIGYAPAGRSILKEHLAQKGFGAEEMTSSGMLIHGPDIPVSYDRFRNRLMFPITDAKDRVIAFGGRALEADAKPKYLNSPETPLFHKGALLFNAAKARSPAYERGQIIVVEGYMDAIALSQAGFPESVAPLGTALTPEQLGLLWRFNPEPTLCFDGDAAGRKAAHRAVETALPHLKPGQSLKFAFLPEGLDPDDLVRQQGPDALAAVLRHALPLIDVLFRKEEAAAQLGTPEGRAALDEKLMRLVQTIAHPAVRDQYKREIGQVLRARHFEVMKSLARSGQRGAAGIAAHRPNHAQLDWRTRHRLASGNGRRPQATARSPLGPATASNELKARQSALELDMPHREALLLRALLNHPWLIDEHAEQIAALHLESEALARLRDAMLQAHALNCPLDRSEIRHQLRDFGHDRVLALVERAITHRSDKFAEPDATHAVVEVGWRHTLALHGLLVELKREIAVAEAAWMSEGSEEAFARLCELKRRHGDADARELVSQGNGEAA